MKQFELPEIEIIKFRVEDIITTSGREDELPLNGQNALELPIIENG